MVNLGGIIKGYIGINLAGNIADGLGGILGVNLEGNEDGNLGIKYNSCSR